MKLKILGFLAALSATPAFALQVTPVFEFTNFYTDNVFDTTGDFFVVNRVNGQQLCAFGPADESGPFPVTTYDCSLDGPAGMELAPGTQSVEWQVQPIYFPAWDRNVVTFVPGDPHEITGVPTDRFLFGTLTFENGSWSGAYTELSFNLTFVADEAWANEAYDFEYSSNLIVQGTPNLGSNTPEQNADFVYLADDPELGSVRAYELFDSPTGSNVVTVQIWGYLASVHPDGFENASGAGFIDSGIELEPSPVPEPGTLGLLGLGLAGLGLSRRRKS